MKTLITTMLLAHGLLSGVLYAQEETPAPTEQVDDAALAKKRQAAADKWVKKEMADAKKVASLLRKVKNQSSCQSVGKKIQKILKPYEAYYGQSAAMGGVNLRLPQGVQGPDLSRLTAGKPSELPAGLTREDISAAQEKMQKQRKKIAATVRAAHKSVDQAVRDNYVTCGGAPTNNMDTSYVDAAAGFVARYMCGE